MNGQHAVADGVAGSARSNAVPATFWPGTKLILHGYLSPRVNVPRFCFGQTLRLASGNRLSAGAVSKGARVIGMSEYQELKELAQLLLNLFESAKGLPEGPERRLAFRKIDDFQRRLSGYLKPRSVAS
jgi:hypothetical protein